MVASELEKFVEKWVKSGASESSNSIYFILELCDVLGVARPDGADGGKGGNKYVFERDSPALHEGGAKSVKKIDLYKEGHFIWESKQGSEKGSKKLGTARRGTPGWHQAMNDALGQALGYSQSFDEAVPFIVVCDVGYCFDIYAGFSGDWQYAPFPNAYNLRIYLKDLPDRPDQLALLKNIFTDPTALDPSKHAVEITTTVAELLAQLGARLEDSGHPSEGVSKFLMRCIFTMFAEDVGLLPDHLFTKYLEHWVKDAELFPEGVSALWRTMNTGGALPMAKILQFNGGLFESCEAFPLRVEDIELLLRAAQCDWAHVEPAIFGTLLEQALSPEERHKLGAHYTPRAYVERLVKPTIEEPLRDEWGIVRMEVRSLVGAALNAKTEKASKTKTTLAVKALKSFHKRLLSLRILDPACGTGNFLYVAMDVLKRLESEVLASILAVSGGSQEPMHYEGSRISPQQFLGIEIKPWAKEIATLVLWIGYLQWHFRQYGKTVAVPEPVLRKYRNIECRDALLTFDEKKEVLDDAGNPVTRWDGVTMKAHSVTGKDVPDESGTICLYEYTNPRKADWPRADFIVGNPPFVGNKRMRAALGDGYVDALRTAFPGVPNTIDLVMYWWDMAAHHIRHEQALHAGLITTNTFSQVSHNSLVGSHLGDPEGSRLIFAIPDHPWVGSSDGANVRVSMTVQAKGAEQGSLFTVVTEHMESNGVSNVVLSSARRGFIGPSLSVGVDVRSCVPLLANRGICQQGVKLVGPRDADGFVVQAEQAELMKQGDVDGIVKPYISSREITQRCKDRLVIDFFGLTQKEARGAHSVAYQQVLDQVKPFRDKNRDPQRKRNWWLFGRSNEKMRASISGLSRYIVTPEVAKHRPFVFVPSPTVPDASLYVIGTEDAAILAVLSSKLHHVWTLKAGGVLEDRPRYQSGPCFEPFPFPVFAADVRELLRTAGESIEQHRMQRRAEHPHLTITGVYNVLEKLRAEEPLTEKEKKIHEQGLVSILKQLHDDLDAAVFDAYGWPTNLTDEQILERLVALNQERVQEEKTGHVRWLRPEFQSPESEPTQQSLSGTETVEKAPAAKAPQSTFQEAWPKKLPAQVTAIKNLFTPRLVLSGDQVGGSFKAAKMPQVTEVLESLAAMGVLLELQAGGQPAWMLSKQS